MTSCKAVQRATGAKTDGDYLLCVNGTVVPIFCYQMNGTAPAEYIDTVLDPQAGRLGYSEYDSAVSEYDGSHYTQFHVGYNAAKLRIVLSATGGRSYIDTSDLTFTSIYVYSEVDGAGGDPGYASYTPIGTAILCNLYKWGEYGGGFLVDPSQSTVVVQLAPSPFVLSSNTYYCGASTTAGSCLLQLCPASQPPFTGCDTRCQDMPPGTTCALGPAGPKDYLTGIVVAVPPVCPPPGTPAVADYSLGPDPATQPHRLYVDLAPPVPPPATACPSLTSCAAVQKAFGTTRDGQYYVCVLGKPVELYCHRMNTTKPLEYISTFEDTFDGLGNAQDVHSETVDGLNKLFYNKLRVVLPATGGGPRPYIDTTDLTFVDNTQPAGTAGAAVGTAYACADQSNEVLGFQSYVALNLGSTGFGLWSNTYRCGASAGPCYLWVCPPEGSGCNLLCGAVGQGAPAGSTCSWGPIVAPSYLSVSVFSPIGLPSCPPEAGAPAAVDFSFGPDPATQPTRIYLYVV